MIVDNLLSITGVNESVLVRVNILVDLQDRIGLLAIVTQLSCRYLLVRGNLELHQVDQLVFTRINYKIKLKHRLILLHLLGELHDYVTLPRIPIQHLLIHPQPLPLKKLYYHIAVGDFANLDKIGPVSIQIHILLIFLVPNLLVSQQLRQLNLKQN